MTPTSTPTSTPAPTAAPRSRRTWWQAVLVLVVLGVAVHVLLPQVDQARRTVTSLGDATWWFVPLAAAFAAMTFPGAAWSLAGSTSRPLRFGSTVEACVASACLGRIAPANLGSLGVSGAYLHATGASVGETTAALGLDAVAGALVHVLLLAATAALVGQFPHAKLALPENFGLIVVIVAVLLVVGVAAGFWWSRRRHTQWGALVHRFVTALREGRVELVGALRSPRRAALLLGGSLVVTLAQIACLATSLAAFDADVDLITIGFVYLAGAAVSAVAPTPGGLGAMEAALVSGLTLFGVAAGPAVTGVLLYRLLTFWGPILPGAVAVRRLRRRHLL